MTLKLSILDLSPLYDSETAAQAFQRTIELARKAEAWGYHRFWVSEHHGSDRLVGSSPEVLISHLLAKTERIRVGSGGVMLQHYSPYKVVENFNVLASPGAGAGWTWASAAGRAACRSPRAPCSRAAATQAARCRTSWSNWSSCCTTGWQRITPCTVCVPPRSRPSPPSFFCSEPALPAPNWRRTWRFLTCSPTS